MTNQTEGDIERKMTEVVVVGVKFFDAYKACYSCNGKVTLSNAVADSMLYI